MLWIGMNCYHPKPCIALLCISCSVLLWILICLALLLVAGKILPCWSRFDAWLAQAGDDVAIHMLWLLCISNKIKRIDMMRRPLWFQPANLHLKEFISFFLEVCTKTGRVSAEVAPRSLWSGRLQGAKWAKKGINKEISNYFNWIYMKYTKDY